MWTAGEPRDRWTYRIATGALGLGLLIVLGGAVVLIAIKAGSGVHHALYALYLVGGVIVGILVGMLIPFRWPGAHSGHHHAAMGDDVAHCELLRQERTRSLIIVALVVLVIIFIAMVAVGVAVHLPAVRILGAVSGGALLGLLVPSPAAREP